MARPRKVSDSPQTRDEILRAARIEFSARGIAAPLDAIAERCGIRRSSLLHHFKSKNILITAVVDDILEKARNNLLEAISAGKGDYSTTMRSVITVLKKLEEEEQGVAGMLAHCLLTEGDGGSLTVRMGEFIEVIHATALMAGAGRNHPSEQIRASIAHLVMGELSRAALGARANHIWGEADGVKPLFDAYFLSDDPAPAE